MVVQLAEQEKKKITKNKKINPIKIIKIKILQKSQETKHQQKYEFVFAWKVSVDGDLSKTMLL